MGKAERGAVGRWIDSHIVLYRVATNGAMAALVVYAVYKLRQLGPFRRYLSATDIPWTAIAQHHTLRGRILGASEGGQMLVRHVPPLLPLKDVGSVSVRPYGIFIGSAGLRTVQSMVGQRCKVKMLLVEGTRPGEHCTVVGDVSVKTGRFFYRDLARMLVHRGEAEVNIKDISAISVNDSTAMEHCRRVEQLLDARPRRSWWAAVRAALPWSAT